MTFSRHYDHVCSKISKTVGVLYKINYFLPKTALICIYYALIYPYLIYAIEVYHGACKTNHNKLFICQKKAVRAVNNASHLTHSDELFKSDKFLKLEDIHHYQCSIYMYKSLFLLG